MTSRIENDPIDQTWRSEANGAPLTTIDMGPLREAEALEIAQRFDNVATQIVEICVDRAGGNPLFLEQLLRNTTEGSEEAIPGSIQGLVQARVDRLASRDRNALRTA